MSHIVANEMETVLKEDKLDRAYLYVLAVY